MMKNGFIYIIIFLASTSSFLDAETILFVDEKPSDLKYQFNDSQISVPNADSLIDDIISLGYLNASYKSHNDTLFVTTGDIYYLKQIIIDEIDTVRFFENNRFTQNKIQEEIKSLVDNDKKNGYLFTEYKIDRFVREDNLITVIINKNNSPQVVFDQMRYDGLERTKTESIDNYFYIEKGTTITPQLLESIERNAGAMTFVTFKAPIRLSVKPGYKTADLLLTFEEKQQFMAAGGGGYISEDKSFVWDIDLKFLNMFGSGRYIDIQSEKKNKDRQNLKLRYRQPLFFFGIGEGGFDLSTRDYREEFYEFVVRGDMQTEFRNRLLVGLSTQWKSVEPSGEQPSFQSYSTRFSIGLNKFNQQLNPQSGYAAHWIIEYGYRKYKTDSIAVSPQKSSFNETRIEIGSEYIQPLVNSISCFLKAEYTGLESDENLPPLSELYLLGGPGTIRGFRNEQFSAIRTVCGTIEPHLNFESGYLFVFSDAAYIYNRIGTDDGQIQSDEFYRLGYGAGFAIKNEKQTIQLSFGWNKEISFDQPRLSVSFSSGL